MPSNNVFDMKIVHENTHLTELCDRNKCQNTVPAKDGYGAEVTVGPGGVGEVRHGEDHPDQDGCHAGGVGDHHGHGQEDVGRQVHAAHLRLWRHGGCRGVGAVGGEEGEHVYKYRG